MSPLPITSIYYSPSFLYFFQPDRNTFSSRQLNPKFSLYLILQIPPLSAVPASAIHSDIPVPMSFSKYIHSIYCDKASLFRHKSGTHCIFYLGPNSVFIPLSASKIRLRYFANTPFGVAYPKRCLCEISCYNYSFPHSRVYTQYKLSIE